MSLNSCNLTFYVKDLRKKVRKVYKGLNVVYSAIFTEFTPAM